MDVTEGHYTNEMLNTEEQRLPFLIYVEDKKQSQRGRIEKWTLVPGNGMRGGVMGREGLTDEEVHLGRKTDLKYVKLYRKIMVENKQATILIYLLQRILNIELFNVHNAKK